MEAAIKNFKNLVIKVEKEWQLEMWFYKAFLLLHKTLIFITQENLPIFYFDIKGQVESENEFTLRIREKHRTPKQA